MVDVTGEAIEVGTEVTVETEGMIEEEEAVVVGDEGLVVEAVTEDVDVDLHLIVQCQGADHDPRVLQGGDVVVVVQDQDLAPDQNNVTSNKQKYRRIITVVSH